MMTAIAGFALLAQVASHRGPEARLAVDTVRHPAALRVHDLEGARARSSYSSTRPGAGNRPVPSSCAEGAACKRKPDYNNDADTPGLKGLY